MSKTLNLFPCNIQRNFLSCNSESHFGNISQEIFEGKFRVIAEHNSINQLHILALRKKISLQFSCNLHNQFYFLTSAEAQVVPLKPSGPYVSNLKCKELGSIIFQEFFDIHGSRNIFLKSSHESSKLDSYSLSPLNNLLYKWPIR